MSDEVIIIRQPEHRIVIQETETPVSVSSDGPQGPAGPAGPPGAAGGEIYEHVQAVASSTWVVNHDLGVYPDVTVIVDDEEIYPGVVHNSLNQASLVFNSPRAGTARFRP